MTKKPRAKRKPKAEQPYTPPTPGETEFSAQLRKEFDKHWSLWLCKLYRNNCGKWRDNYGHWITYGLAVGSPDSVGYKTITITPDMVNKKIAVFVGAEAKTNSDTTDNHDQWTFLKTLHDAGGIALLVNAKRGLLEAIDQIRNWQPGQEFTLPEPPKKFDDAPWNALRGG